MREHARFFYGTVRKAEKINVTGMQNRWLFDPDTLHLKSNTCFLLFHHFQRTLDNACSINARILPQYFLRGLV